MGITSNLAASRLIQPGVIASSSERPAAPYEGQCIYQKDTNQLLVWDGSAWVIPNSPAQNPTGLEFVKSATATNGASSVTIDNCFSSTYENYRVVFNYANATSGYPAVYLQARKNGVNDGSSNYYQMGTGYGTNGVSYSYGTGELTSIYIGGLTGISVFDVFAPFDSTVQTLVSGSTIFYDGSRFVQRSIGGWINIVDTMDGMSFTLGSSTFTTKFKVRVYGYRNS